MSIDFNYGFGNAKNLLAKVKRDENKLYHAVMPQESDSISDAVFNQNKISCIPILNKNDKPVGILSWRDIMKALGKAE